MSLVVFHFFSSQQPTANNRQPAANSQKPLKLLSYPHFCASGFGVVFYFVFGGQNYFFVCLFKRFGGVAIKVAGVGIIKNAAFEVVFYNAVFERVIRDDTKRPLGFNTSALWVSKSCKTCISSLTSMRKA